MATLTIPTTVDHTSKLPKWRMYTIHFSIKSAGTLSMVSPKRSLICVVKMVTAIPLVKPTTMG